MGIHFSCSYLHHEARHHTPAVVRLCDRHRAGLPPAPGAYMIRDCKEPGRKVLRSVDATRRQQLCCCAGLRSVPRGCARGFGPSPTELSSELSSQLSSKLSDIVGASGACASMTPSHNSTLTRDTVLGRRLNGDR